MATPSSGALLQEARQRAGVTQSQLAERAGVAQSVISAYESGHRHPALRTLAALIDAAGFDLDTRVRPLPANLRHLNGPLGRRVRQRRLELIATAAEHGLTGLRVFGSVARGDDTPTSDVDLLVDVPADISLIGLSRARSDLEDILGATVDLVPAADLKPAVRRRIASDLIAL